MNLYAVLVIVQVLWTVLAGVTFCWALVVTWTFWRVDKLMTMRPSPADVRRWNRMLVSALCWLALVALCNFMAGVYSLLLPIRPDAVFPPHDRIDWAPIIIPSLFIMSALGKLVAVNMIYAGHRAVTSDGGR